MADQARCLCALDADGKIATSHFGCPFHGFTSYFPRVPWVLWHNDKRFLRSLRIDPEDTPEIQDIRQADEDRFKP